MKRFNWVIWKSRYNNLPLFKKIFFIIITMVICIYGFYFVNVQFLLKSYEKSLYQTEADSLKHVGSSIEFEMTMIQALADQILADDTIQENLIFLLENPVTDRRHYVSSKIYESLYPYFNSNKYVTSIAIIQNPNQIVMGSPLTSTQEEINLLDSETEDKNGRVLFTTTTQLPGTLGCIRQIRQIPSLSLRNLGLMYIQIDMVSLIEDALEGSGYTIDSEQFVLLWNDHRIYPEEAYHQEYCQQLAADADGQHNFYKIDTIDRRKRFIVSGAMSHIPWNYFYFLDFDRLFLHTQRSKLLTLLNTAFFCLIAIVLIRSLLGAIFRHMDYLLEKIQKFGDGTLPLPLSPSLYDTRQDEIGQLHRSFDDMTQSIKLLRDENYDRQILLKDATIKMLEQQINPHFLYNTLDTINWLAKSCGSSDISDMSRSLGNLFRISITEKREIIPLSEELDILSNYIKIQKIRFRDRLDFEISTPVNCSQILVPKLCIQPLVENALKYAMECSDEPCKICVTVEEQENTYRIQVANTGSSFEDNLLEKLEHSEIESQGSGVGLININSRLRLIFGDNYGLRLCNCDEMAVVILTIPKTACPDHL